MKKNPKARKRFPMLGTNHMVYKEPRGARKMRLTNLELEEKNVCFGQIFYFAVIYIVYIIVSVACIMLSAAALFFQYLVNNYMNLSVSIGFLTCLTGVLLGVVIAGVWVWRSSKN